MTRREKWGAYGAWASVCFFWGTTYLAIRIGLETMPPLLFGGLRFLIAGALVFGFLRLFRRSPLPRGREWFDLSLVGLMLLGIGNGMVVWAEQWVASGMAALLVATAPFWFIGIESLLRDGERLTGRVVAGLLLGFGGLALLIGPDVFGVSLSGSYILGILALQVACASWSAGTVYAKHRRTSVQPLMGAAVQMLIAGLALTLIGTMAGEWPAMRFSERSLGAFLYLIVFGSIVAYSSYTYAVQKLPLSLVSTYSYINPVIAVLLGWAILSEPLGWRMALATTIILAGVLLVKTARKIKRMEGPPPRENETKREPLQPTSHAYSAGAD